VIPATCPCCEVLHPPHRDGCTFEHDCPNEAAIFDEMSALRAEIARLREERRWISVGERLPDEGVKVLAFDPLFPVIQSARRDGHGWNCEGLDFLTPTHWQPLPPWPEGDA